MLKQKVILLVAAMAMSAACLAADVVGHWTGKVEIGGVDKTNKQVQAGMKMVPSIAVDFKKDKTYKATQSMNGKSMVAEGTWSQSGNKVTMVPKTRDGKAVSGPGAEPRVYTLGADGKTMVLDLSARSREAAKAQMKGHETKDSPDMSKMTVKVVLHKG